MKDSKRNVFWFLIDGLSPAHLRSCGNNKVEHNFFDELIEKGYVFTNVASTAAGTHTAMHSVFSSMYPSVNGATGWSIEAQRKFNQCIFTLTDYFKLKGYSTFRYGDAIKERDVPKSGFDVWESSGVPISELLEKTDFTDNERRRKFISRVNECNQYKFVYHHSLILHELNSLLGNKWSSNDYEKNIIHSAEVFRKIYKSYSINKNDIVIISSDHGVILDSNWIEDGDANGERHYEQSVKTFFCILGGGIDSGIFEGLISSIDEAPTITDLVLGIQMSGQGRSRVSTIRNVEYSSPIVYREKGTYCTESYRNSLTSDVFYVRQDNWKYVYSVEDERCEWLINLDEGDYKVNHKEDKEKVRYFRNLIENTFFSNNTVQKIYKDNGSFFSKNDQPIRISVIIDSKYLTKKVYDSLIDLAGPYYEIIVLNSTNSFNRFNVRSFEGGLDSISLDFIKGKRIVVLESECEYSEYLLSDLEILFAERDEAMLLVFNTGFAVSKQFFKNRRHLEKETVSIREYDAISEHNILKRLLRRSEKKIIVDFYLIDSFEIFHFKPLYKAFIEAGIDARFIAEPCNKNTAKTWFDYNNAINILNDNSLLYLTHYRANADIAFTTQDAYLLGKYKSKTTKINLSYGFSYKRDYFIHSSRTTKGFDYRFVHGDEQKEILSEYIDKSKILKVGYPKYSNKLDSYPSKKEILNELKVATEKPILVYFPTWDEDNSIKTYANVIKSLKDRYFVVSKAHHCTSLEKNPDDYKTLVDISDLVLEGNYDFGKAALIGDIAVADAKSGASFEIAYVNTNIPIVLVLKSKEDGKKYKDEMWDYFSVVDNMLDLPGKVDELMKEDLLIQSRNSKIERCYGNKKYNYLPIILEFIRWVAKR